MKAAAPTKGTLNDQTLICHISGNESVVKRMNGNQEIGDFTYTLEFEKQIEVFKREVLTSKLNSEK